MFLESEGQQSRMHNVFEAFQQLLRSEEPDYQLFLHEITAKQRFLNEKERIRSHVLVRLSKALEGFIEQRAGTSDVSVLLRQTIRTYERRLEVKRSLWQVLSSREDDIGLRLVGESEPEMVVVASDPWRPNWLPEANNIDIDQLEARRHDTPSVGDGLLCAMTRGTFTTYQSEAQKAAVQASLFAHPGSTLLVTLPTGSGKSLCIQLPAWQESRGGRIKGGTTLVIVPTVSLALDQEKQAQGYFLEAPSVEYRPCSITSATPEIAKATIRQGLLNGTLPIIYMAPETLMHSSFYNICLEAARQGTLNRLVIDEAHLVETWGAGFRTEFQFLSAYHKKLLEASDGRLRTLLLSATITQSCEKLLRMLFGSKSAFFSIRADRLRPEISYWFDYSETLKTREEHVIDALRHLPRPTILYVSSPDDTKKWLRVLREQGFERIAAFSSETEADEKKRLIDEWSKDKRDIMVATSAFGVGVDKASVRTIIHACLPENINRLYQEVGRAGRDGYSAISLLCTAKGDYQRAYSMTRAARITTDKAISRWEGMQNTRILSPNHSDLVLFDTNAPPSANPEMYQGPSNREWNEHTLLLMQRAGLIEIADMRDELNLTVSTNAQGNAVNASMVSAWLLVRLLKPHLTSFSGMKEFHASLEEIREKEAKSVRTMLGDMRKLVQSYATSTASKCIASIFSGFYPGSALACGGCPACRREMRSPYVGSLQLEIDLKFAPLLSRLLNRGLEDKMGRRKRINVFLDEPRESPPLQMLQHLLLDLVRIGFQQLILPATLTSDTVWVKDLVRKLAEHASIPHTIFLDTWVTSREERPICAIPTIVVYPLQDEDADQFHRAFRQREATQFKGIPLITVVHRDLVLESESGRYIDRINGIAHSIESLLAILEDLQGLPF